MKSFKYKIFFVLIVILVSLQDLFANNEPPAPRGSGGFEDAVVVGGAIDSYILLMLFVGFILGAYYLRKIKLKLAV